jgi:hypothetical protein
MPEMKKPRRGGRGFFGFLLGNDDGEGRTHHMAACSIEAKAPSLQMGNFPRSLTRPGP